MSSPGAAGQTQSNIGSQADSYIKIGVALDTLDRVDQAEEKPPPGEKGLKTLDTHVGDLRAWISKLI